METHRHQVGNWVGLTLILAIPLSARFCLSIWARSVAHPNQVTDLMSQPVFKHSRHLKIAEKHVNHSHCYSHQEREMPAGGARVVAHLRTPTCSPGDRSPPPRTPTRDCARTPRRRRPPPSSRVPSSSRGGRPALRGRALCRSGPGPTRTAAASFSTCRKTYIHLCYFCPLVT